jgi:UDP-N-acetyl-D-galactosamine dehydrogenase
VDIVRELRDFNITVDVHDPWADADEARRAHGLDLIATPQAAAYDGIVLAVAHQEFKAMPAAQIRAFGKARHILYDLKYILPAVASDLRL